MDVNFLSFFMFCLGWFAFHSFSLKLSTFFLAYTFYHFFYLSTLLSLSVCLNKIFSLHCSRTFSFLCNMIFCCQYASFIKSSRMPSHWKNRVFDLIYKFPGTKTLINREVYFSDHYSNVQDSLKKTKVQI